MNKIIDLSNADGAKTPLSVNDEDVRDFCVFVNYAEEHQGEEIEYEIRGINRIGGKLKFRNTQRGVVVDIAPETPVKVTTFAKLADTYAQPGGVIGEWSVERNPYGLSLGPAALKNGAEGTAEIEGALPYGIVGVGGDGEVSYSPKQIRVVANAPKYVEKSLPRDTGLNENAIMRARQRAWQLVVTTICAYEEARQSQIATEVSGL